MLSQAIQGIPGTVRIRIYATDFLSTQKLPVEADIWWMSQFLDCFSKDQIISILRLIRKSMKPESKIFILENFGDRQRFEAATYCINASSLYFTCMANGNSRFYPSDILAQCIQEAELKIEKDIDNIGIGGHTLLVCTANTK